MMICAVESIKGDTFSTSSRVERRIELLVSACATRLMYQMSPIQSPKKGLAWVFHRPRQTNMAKVAKPSVFIRAVARSKGDIPASTNRAAPGKRRGAQAPTMKHRVSANKQRHESNNGQTCRDPAVVNLRSMVIPVSKASGG